jgi:hypothetical protein
LWPHPSFAAVLEECLVFGNPFSRQAAPSKLSEADDADDVNVSGQTHLANPAGQLFVLGCCRLSEPVSMTSSAPYLYFMIRDFDMSSDEKEIGRHGGF